MNIYTKGGDKGTTSLVHTKNVSKSDDRIQLVGTIDELTSHIGLVKSMLTDLDMIQNLEKIQSTLITLMAGIADPYKRDYRISDEETSFLEAEIDRLEGLFDRPKEFILPGGSRLSAETDVARTVARRGERVLAAVSVKFGADNGAKKYMNRLADYLYVLARYIDAREMGHSKDSASGKEEFADKKNLQNRGSIMGQKEMPVSEAVIQEVLGWNANIFNMIQTLSENVIVPIAGLVITYVLCYELISMVTEKNNMHDIETFMFFKWIFKAFVAVFIVTNTFNITMAVFDMAQHIVSGAAGVIGGDTNIDVAEALAAMQEGLEDMEIPELLLLVLETSLVSLCMKIMSVLITVILYGRMIEIYRASRSAAFHPKAVRGHFGNPALASR